MKQITIIYDGEGVKLATDGALVAEVVIILNEALERVCFELDKPVEQALTIAYSMQDKGELFNELEEAKNGQNEC